MQLWKKKKRKPQQSLKLVPRGQDRKKKEKKERKGQAADVRARECRNCGFHRCRVATSVGELPGV